MKAIFLLTHFELYSRLMRPRESTEGMTMADRSSLKFVGFIFATVTIAVMLTTAMVVKTHADAYAVETTASIQQ